MREIKFRAWDKEEKKLSYVSEIYWSSSEICIWREKNDDYELLPWDDRLILMQYTGIKDKNGKEIFEGDIVRFGNHTNIIAPVVYEGSMFLPDDKYTKGKMTSSLGFYAESELEVLGNIYENPDLLN